MKLELTVKAGWSETTVYRNKFLVIDCPYCGEIHYIINSEDDYGEGYILLDGRRKTCKKCGEQLTQIK